MTLRYCVLLALLGMLGAGYVSAQTTQPLRPLVSDASAPLTGAVRGRIIDAATGEPLAGVNVFIEALMLGAASDARGQFEIPNVPIGEHQVSARMLGFQAEHQAVLLNMAEHPVQVVFLLNEDAVPLSEVVVTPGRFAMQKATPESVRTLSQEDLSTVSQLGEDVYRAVTRLPGLAGNDFSAKFTVRGGEHDEVLVTFDGLELFDPFHVKDIGGGALSIVDVEAIGGVDLLTGAFPAEFGNRLSGVFNLTSASPNSRKGRTSLGISFMNARAFSEGTFAQGKGEWMVLGRRGYLDLVLGLTGDHQGFSPRYYDGFAKTQYQFGNHTLSLQSLISHDALDYVEVNEPEDRARTEYGNAYVWSNWRAVWSKKLFSHTIASRSSVWRQRAGADYRRADGDPTFIVSDDRGYDVLGLKQDWTLDAAPNYLIKWGFNLKQFDARYAYDKTERLEELVVGSRALIQYDESSLNLSPSGLHAGLYTGHRIRFHDRFTMELGLRYDHTSWARDATWSPRVNAVYVLGEKTILRGGWGHFYQAQGVHELGVQDGDGTFYPSEKSIHTIVGLEQAFSEKWSLRLDAYKKDKSQLRPRFVNLNGDATNLFPEAGLYNRVRVLPASGIAKGIEVLLRKQSSDKLNGWLSYSLARTDDHIDGQLVPKSFDQRHTVYFDLNYRPSSRFSINLAWQYHTGWRYSDLSVELVRPPGVSPYYRSHWGPMNARQFPAYHRLDVRISRHFQFKQTALATFLEVRNVYNRRNIRVYNYQLVNQPDDSVLMIPEPRSWLPILLAFGIRWDLRH